MKFIKKNKVLSIAILIEVILLLLCVGDYFLPRFSLDLTGESIASTGVFQDNAWYTDEDMSEAGFFAFNELVTLPRGVFRVSIDYNCTSSKNTVLCMGKDTTVNSIVHDDITFNPNQSNVSFTLWANKKIEEFRLSAIFGGEGSFEVSRIFIAETYAGSTMLFLLVLFWSLVVDIAIVAFTYYRRNDIPNASVATIFVLALVTFFASAPLFSGYLIKGHDLIFHLMRIEGIKDGLLSGQFPVKIQPTPMNGYGYATSVFYGDVFLYIPALLRIFGFPLQTTYMLYVFLVNLATTLITYFSISGMLNSRKIALLGTVLYVLSPYRLVNIYGRAAVGEYTAMIFIPLLALGLYRIYKQNPAEKVFSKNWILPVIAYTGIIESHILSCEIVGFFTIIICLVFFRQTFQAKRFLVLCKIVFATILVNLGFLLPLADYMIKKNCLISHGVMTSNGIQQSSLTLARFASIFLNGNGMPQARIAFRQAGMSNEMGISVGIALLLSFVLYLYFLIIKHKKKTTNYQFGKFLWFFSFAILFMTSEYFPWDTLDNVVTSLIQSLQFPWRIFGVGTFTLALVGCCALEFIHANYKEHFATAYIILAVGVTILTSGYLMDSTLYEKTPFYVYSEYALPMESSGSNFDEYVPAEYDDDFELTGNYEVSSPDVIVTGYSKDLTNIKGTLTNRTDQVQSITLPLFYYPGYKVESTDGRISCGSSDTALVQLTIPAGYAGDFRVKFAQSRLWIISEVISALSIAGIGCILLIPLIKKK